MKKNVSRRNRKKKKKKKPLSKKELSERTSMIMLGVCLLTFSDLYGMEKEELPKFFQRFNENLAAFNEGNRRLIDLARVCKDEYGIDIRKV